MFAEYTQQKSRVDIEVDHYQTEVNNYLFVLGCSLRINSWKNNYCCQEFKMLWVFDAKRISMIDFIYLCSK